MKEREKFKRDLNRLLLDYNCYLSVNIKRDQKNAPCDTADLIVNFLSKVSHDETKGWFDTDEYEAFFKKIRVEVE